MSSAPAAKFGDQNGIDLSGLRQLHDLLAGGVTGFHTGSRFSERGDHLKPAALGETGQVEKLALARLVRG